MRSAIPVFALAMALSPQAALAADTKSMKDCVDYMRGNKSIAPYFPVDDDGQVNRAALNKLVKEKMMKYTLDGDREVVTSNNGGLNVRIEIERQSGRVQTITSKSVWGVPDYRFGGIMGSSPMAGSSTEVHKFRFQGNTCIPESATAYSTLSTDLTSIKNGREIYNVDICRAVVEFFRKHPAAKACGDDNVAKALEAIVEKTKPPYNEVSMGVLGTRTHGQFRQAGVEQGSLWYNGIKLYETCTQTPGLGNAVQSDGLWKSASPSGETMSQETVQ